VTTFAFLNLETADDARYHPSVATGTAQLGFLRLNRLRVETHSTSQTEARVIGIAGKTLWTDQAATIADQDDRRTTVAAVLVCFLRQGTAGATALNRRVRTLERRGLEAVAAATIEGTARRQLGDVVLRMALGTGDKLQADSLKGPIGRPGKTLDEKTKTRRRSRSCRPQPSRKPLSERLRLGCRSLRNAFASI